MTRRLTIIALLAALAVVPGARLRAAPGQRGSPIEPLPPVPPHLMFVPVDVAERMLELAKVAKNDVVYDLGCGEGRLAIAAAKKYGVRSVGVDNDRARIAAANAAATQQGVSNLVRFVQANTIDLSEATVVTMFAPQSVAWLSENGLLQTTLIRQLKAGARIVTNVVPGSMKDWKPDRVDHFADARGNARATIYLWKVQSTKFKVQSK